MSPHPLLFCPRQAALLLLSSRDREDGRSEARGGETAACQGPALPWCHHPARVCAAGHGRPAALPSPLLPASGERSSFWSHFIVQTSDNRHRRGQSSPKDPDSRLSFVCSAAPRAVPLLLGPRLHYPWALFTGRFLPVLLTPRLPAAAPLSSASAGLCPLLFTPPQDDRPLPPAVMASFLVASCHICSIAVLSVGFRRQQTITCIPQPIYTDPPTTPVFPVPQ